MSRVVDRLVDWSLRMLLKQQDVSSISDGRKRKASAYLEAWVSIVGNIALFIAKLVIGVAINSVAMITDSVHTLSDVLTSVVVIVGFRLAETPPDKEHPFGHGRFENVAALVISILLAIAGVQLGITSFKRLLPGSGVEVIASGVFPVAVMLLSAVAKEAMALYSMSIGLRIDSQALKADGWHHRTDAIASGLVAVGLVGAAFGMYSLDAIFGVGVAGLVAYTGIGLIKDATSSLVGRAPDPDEVSRLTRLAMAVAGVQGVHDVVVHDYGSLKRVSLHIEVSPKHSVGDAHDIASEVEEALMSQGGMMVVVHVDPVAVSQAVPTNA